MLPELTNLLPPERKRTLARAYLFRLLTLAFFAAGAVCIAHGILLFPAYAYLLEENEIQKERVAELSERREVSGFTDVSERIAAFSARAASLEELRTHPAASDALYAVLKVPRSGVRITSFGFAAPEGGEPGRMQVAGVAATREALRAFDSALASLPFVRSTDLPLSAYARESSIPFSIALTLDFSMP